MLVECPGVVVTDSDGSPLCEDGSGAAVAWVEVEGSPWLPEITVEQAMQLSGAALLLWAVAFAGLMLRRVLERSKP